ncbi:MAG: isopeptide-forming domain-containing fimbrial protein [Candidatus Eremiobacteraeota bacterium]|nr:isopeptide-forming domain-containing fimbrial protein [Candidatus Eremiobacteraeota bacterium]MBC5804318.1 isopeptide-forming domain-containing fimbrial protein [Candidatus Eremiobacteraeota bacterium]MBC5822368.1 isopeptide-forming domain-containing fimbrial protein [Candidatus Eremiobacteraeota bacterium]
MSGLTAVAVLTAATCGEAATPAGTLIENTASATYASASGQNFTTVSNTVTATVSAVGALSVGPKETVCDPATDAAAAGVPVTKQFTIANAGNTPSTYTIAAAQTSAGKIAGIAFITPAGAQPVMIGVTSSPVVAPGQSVGVQVIVDVTGVPVGSHVTVTLTARSGGNGTATGAQSDTGSACIVLVPGASFSGPGGVGTPVNKTVNGVRFVAAPGGGSVTYAVTFEDFSAVALHNAVFSDTVPAGLVMEPASVKLDGAAAAASVNGQGIKLLLGTVAPGVAHVVNFSVGVPSGAALGTSYVNVATLSADNAPAATSLPAALSVGVGNIIYDGYSGGAAPVANATIALVDPRTGKPLVLTGSGTGVNPNNANPFVTSSSGAYAFALSANQLGMTSAPVTYDVLVSAPGFTNRRIAITLTPRAGGLLYDVSAKALDGQPLAVAGGFTLAGGPVSLDDVFGLFGNIPLFSTRAVTLVKSVDRPIAAGGDRLVWTLQYSNATVTPLGSTSIVDTLPRGIAYAPGSGRLDGVRLEPTVSGSRLSWTVPALDRQQHEIVFASVLSPGIAEGTVLTNGATIAAAIPGSPGVSANATASAAVRVIAGVFSDCAPITGRVYADLQGSSYFERGDLGVPSVRVYLEGGESVATDAFGRFSFPCVRPGMHVLRLDTTTLPATVRAYGERGYDSERSVRRLVHGLFDGTTIQDVNFALEPVR